jgi:hypothetical protein
MVGWLDEGLRGGIKAWSEDLAWHLEVGGRAGEEDEAHSPGPLDREMREKRPARKT